MRTHQRTLAIDTATQACSVALFEGADLLAGQHKVLGRGHAEHLVPMIEALPDKGQADQILVSLGPGSFTGVRIGVAAARALGFAWHAKVLGYPTLALVAAMAQDAHQSDPVTVCMNGGHGEWFVQNFTAAGQPQGRLLSLTPEDAQASAHHSFAAGNRAEELLALDGPGMVALDILPDARKAGLLSEILFTANLAPIYGRGPDAKLPQA